MQENLEEDQPLREADDGATELSMFDILSERLGRPIKKETFIDAIRYRQAKELEQTREKASETITFRGEGIEFSSILSMLSEEQLDGFIRNLDLMAQEISKVSPQVLRDAHVIALARGYLRSEYSEVLDYLSKNTSEWFPQDKKSEGKEAQEFYWNHSPLEDLSLIAQDIWRDIYGTDSPTVSHVQTIDVQTAADTLLAGWAELLGVDFKIRGPAAALAGTAPIITTDKAAQNIFKLNEQTKNLTPGRNHTLTGRDVEVTVTMGGLNPSPVRLTATHTLVTDALGALYRRHQEETGRDHALFSLSQIVQQIMRTNKPTEEQQREVEQHIDVLRQYNVEINGLDFDGNAIRIEGDAVFAYKTVVTTKKGNTATGYQLLDVPALFNLSERQRSARQVDAILEPRKGGWKPPGIPGMTVYNVVARRLFQFHGSRFKPSKAFFIYYKDMQENLGAEYSPDVITPWRERTVRNYVENSIKELYDRGLITRFQDQYSGRKKIGFRIWLPAEFPELNMTPEDRRRLEVR